MVRSAAEEEAASPGGIADAAEALSAEPAAAQPPVDSYEILTERQSQAAAARLSASQRVAAMETEAR